VENPSRKKKSQQQIPFSEFFRFFRSNPSTKVRTDEEEEEEEEFRTQTNNNNNNNLFRVRVSNYNDDMKQATKHTLLPRKTRIGSRIFQLPNSQNAVFYVRTSANAIFDNTQSLSHR
jgi:DNA-binding GntR family transcriptional regulator